MLVSVYKKLFLLGLTAILSACVSINTVPNAGGQGAKTQDLKEENVREKKVSLGEAANYNVSLGAQYLKKGKVNQAISKLEKAISQEPNLPLAHSYLGFAYEKIGEIEKAKVSYSKAVSLDATNPVAANNYGTFLCRQNALDESLVYFERAAENRMYQTPEAAYANAGMCARKIPDNIKAKEYFSKVLQYQPKSQEALWNLADLSIDANKLKDAQLYYKNFSLLLPRGKDNADQLLLAYRLAKASGDNNMATQYARLLKAKFPKSEQAKKLDRS